MAIGPSKLVVILSVRLAPVPGAPATREAPGMSAFALENGSSTTYIRGPDGLWGMYQWLDRAPRGRNETMVRGFW
jgi:predicted dithiol-disulfide oxidoreductase (DUF899 family)